MSTIVRGRVDRRSPGSARAPLAARAIRVRNACVRRAAAQLGLPVPGEAELSGLGNDVSLAGAVDWWRATHVQDKTHTHAGSTARGRLVPKLAFMTAVALLSLALSFGQLQ